MDASGGLRMSYTNQRDHFEKLLRKYTDYLDLYADMNGGSMKGASTFDEFYLRYTYLDRYSDPSKVKQAGY